MLKVSAYRNWSIAFGVLKKLKLEFEAKNYKSRLQIRVKTNKRLAVLGKLTELLESEGFKYNPDHSSSSLGRIEIRDAIRGTVYLLVKPLNGNSANIGIEYENHLSQLINKNNLGYKSKTAGSGHGSDLMIYKKNKELKIELKTSLGADFGQFRAYYDLEKRLWLPRESENFLKNKKVFGSIFKASLAEFLNQNCFFDNHEDERLSLEESKIIGLKKHKKTGILKKELQNKWFKETTSYRNNIDINLIKPYYLNKGDEFIQIKNYGLYSLKDEEVYDIPSFWDNKLEAGLRFRLKPSMGANSKTGFVVAIRLKGSLTRSPFSLDNEEDVKKLLLKLEKA